MSDQAVSPARPAPVRIEHDGPVSRLSLARPDRRNALDPEMIDDLSAALSTLGRRSATRVVVLAGDGRAFCAGADISYMRAMAEAGREANLEDARRLAALFGAVRECPKPVVARVHGAALGGGLGLVAASDIAVAAEDTVFGFTEARLGILPAVISPFVVPRIGPAAARELFLTGARFDANRARRLALVTRTTAEAHLDCEIEGLVDELLAGGPAAQAAIKRLLSRFDAAADLTELTATLIAEARASAEGQEGLAAFLERRRPAWAGQPEARGGCDQGAATGRDHPGRSDDGSRRHGDGGAGDGDDGNGRCSGHACDRGPNHGGGT